MKFRLPKEVIHEQSGGEAVVVIKREIEKALKSVKKQQQALKSELGDLELIIEEKCLTAEVWSNEEFLKCKRKEICRLKADAEDIIDKLDNLGLRFLGSKINWEACDGLFE